MRVAFVADGAHEAHERLHRGMGEVVEDAAARLARAAGRAPVGAPRSLGGRRTIRACGSPCSRAGRFAAIA